nr:13850_t:CDS:2 [Entrophospora candida]
MKNHALCSEGIHFDAGNQRICCLAHIINLAAQEALKSLKGMGPEKKDDALGEDDDKINVIKKPFHNMVSADKELRSYILLKKFQIYWSNIQISNAHYPTLGQSVPIYNYLIDLIEDFLEKAKDKLQKFYPTSDGLVYIVATKKISDLWKIEYMPIQEHDTTIQTTKPPNTLESHILKRHKNIQTDELDMYLNSPPLNFVTDVLSFWKAHGIS